LAIAKNVILIKRANWILDLKSHLACLIIIPS
jgi:hypothetical protein